MSVRPLVSIIISNYNGEKFIGECLNSIFQDTNVPFEIILVDNGSKDENVVFLKKKVQQDKRVKLILFKNNLGPAKARNLAVQESQGKYLMFLDYDTVVGKNWLTETFAYLERNPEIGGGQLKILRMDRKNIFDSAGEKLTPFGFLAERAQSARDDGQFDKVENIFSGKGAAMIVRRGVFEKVGGFDNDYFMYWEEPDLCWRIWKAGFRFVFLPMGTIYHAYGSADKPVSQTWATQIIYLGCRNQIATIVKNGLGLNALRMLLLVTLAWLGFLFMFLLKLNFTKAKAIIRAFFWLSKNHYFLSQKRASLRKRLGKRFAQDRKWFAKIIVKKGINWYLGKGIGYILGKAF